MRYVVENIDGSLVYDVTNMFDCHGVETEIVSCAETLVVKISQDEWLSGSADDYDIYTVH